jgi:PAS domain S-box-containing protein
MEQLKQDMGDSYLPVVALTAQPAHKLRALKAGAKDFISKPFDLLEVTARIYNVLEVRLLYRELEDHNARLEQKVEQRTAELRESEQRFRRLTALASDWYWEQNESGDFTHVSGPVLPMVGIRMTAFLGDPLTADGAQWRHEDRAALRQKIMTRQPFIDFAFSRINADGSEQQFRVSGEPIFNEGRQFTGYRGVGVAVTAKPPM